MAGAFCRGVSTLNCKILLTIIMFIRVRRTTANERQLDQDKVKYNSSLLPGLRVCTKVRLKLRESGQHSWN